MKKLIIILFLATSFLFAQPVFAVCDGKDVSKARRCTISLQAKNISGVDVVTVIGKCGKVYTLYMLNGRYLTESQAFDIIHGQKADI